MKEHAISHLVKSEDINHHGTLFAGRASEWLVEGAFIAASSAYGNTKDVVCVNVHGFTFKRPVSEGDIFTIHSRVVKVGRTSITVYVYALSEINQTHHVDGFITFVCVNPDTKTTLAHNLSLDVASNDFEKDIRLRAQNLIV